MLVLTIDIMGTVIKRVNPDHAATLLENLFLPNLEVLFWLEESDFPLNTFRGKSTIKYVKPR
jgi:hypothetical protein